MQEGLCWGSIWVTKKSHRRRRLGMAAGESLRHRSHLVFSLTSGDRNRGKELQRCRCHAKLASRRRCRNHGEVSFSFDPRVCPDAWNQILRVGGKAIFVLQPKAWHPQMGAPCITGNRTRNLRHDNCSRCPLGYKPCEHRKIESSLILSCSVHRAYSQVEIGYDYPKT